MFGKAFYREHGEEPANLWNQAVWALTDKQIVGGLANLANEGLTFPPTLSQFVAACKKPAPRKGWVKSTMIEDKRAIGRMSRLEWMELNDE